MSVVIVTRANVYLLCLRQRSGPSFNLVLPNPTEHLVTTAENVDDAVFKVVAHEALGFTLFARGKFAAAHAALERSISMCEDSKTAASLDLSGQDPRVHVRLYDGMALWFLGYPDQVRALYVPLICISR
jgi:hypothetical protein